MQENELRKLQYRASHRGIREMDIILGGYAEEHLKTMSAEVIAVFEEILEIDDQSLFQALSEGEQHDAEIDLRTLSENLQVHAQNKGYEILLHVWHWTHKGR